jgi:tetratricopeptide (TPR) repeat protein
MANDWFTKTSWSGADQADFYAHLKRSRKASNRAQYLRVQADRLERVGSPELLQAAIVLLDKMLAECPELTQLAWAYSQKASCLAKLGDLDQAVALCRRALEAERKFPNSRSQASNDFGRLVAENRIMQLYDEALAVLDGMKHPGTQFPSDVYKSFGIRALIAADRGEIESAPKFAKVALNAAAKDHSGFRYHPNFGLVQDRESRFHKTIEAVANGRGQSFLNSFCHD